MIFLFLIVISILVTWDFEKKQIRFALLPYLIVAIYIVSLMPTLPIPYLVDDLDILHTLRMAETPAQKIAWLLTPHNEHVIPAVKAVMAFLFNLCNIYMLPIHVIIIAGCALILIVFYKLLLKLTQSAYTALFGTALLASTNLPDFAAYMFIEANLFFCLCFFLLLFYAQIQFFATRQKRWLVLAFISCVLNPVVFNLGVTSIAFALLFEYLCISSAWRTKIPILFAIFCGWAVSLLPYIYSFQKVIHADHYTVLHKKSALEVAQIFQAIPFLFSYMIEDLIPNFLPHLYLSMALFFLALTFLVRYRDQIDYKKIIFFLLFGAGLSYIIYVFRLSWGPPALDRARYDILPTAMLAAVYAFIFHPYIKEQASAFATNRRLTAICVIWLLLLVSLSATIRYNRSAEAAAETTSTVQRFNIVFRQAFLNYSREVAPNGTFSVKDAIIFAPSVPSFSTRKYHIDIMLLRYPGRRLSFFSTLLLPSDLSKRIIWGETTDKQFISYLNAHADQYGMLIHLLK